MLVALICTLLALAHGGDLASHHVRNAIQQWEKDLPASAPGYKPARPTLVTAAQGSFRGPEVLEVLFKTSNYPALTGINLAVGIIKLGGDGKGGCGVIPFHNHPNCYEVMTTLSGRGAYGQIHPEGHVLHSGVLTKGDMWVIEQGAQHYYRNLDPDSEWTVEIAFTCSGIAAESSWKWINSLGAELVQQFWGLSKEAAINLTTDSDAVPAEGSTRFIADCTGDEKLHRGKGTVDKQLHLDSPTHVPPKQGSGGSVEFYTLPTPGSKNGTGVGMSMARMNLTRGGMQNPAVCYSGHAVVHVLQGEVLVAQWTYDNKMAVEILREHDLVLIPRGSVYFIINFKQHPESEAEMVIHYDTDGKLSERDGFKHYEPRLTVESNFFSSEKATLLEAVLQVHLKAAQELSSASSHNKLFAFFEGDMAALKKWAAAQPQYCPLGCHSAPTSGESIEGTVESVSTLWDLLPEIPLTDHQMRYVFLAVLALMSLVLLGYGLASCGLFGAAKSARVVAGDKATLLASAPASPRLASP